MLIRFNTNKDIVEFTRIFKYNINDTIVNVGKKCLPINLQDVFKKGSKIVLNTLTQSSIGTVGVYITNNNIIDNNNKEYNILYNNLYNNCPDLTMDTVLDKLKERAKGELVDLHYFPIKYKPSYESSEETYVRYNLKNALMVMLEMEQALQWLVGYNNNLQFIVESCDIELTLNSVANKLTDNKEIKSKLVSELVEYYENVMDVNYIASHYKDLLWNVDLFIGKERYIKKLIGFETYNTNQYIGVYLYGDNKLCNWSAITHKLDSSIHLFVAPEHRMMLKRIQTSMNGKHNQFKNYLKDLIGKWFDVEEHWSKLKKYINRVDDSKLDINITSDICKVACSQYFKELGELCYNSISTEEDIMPVKNNNLIAEITQQQSDNNDVYGKELPVIDAQATNTQYTIITISERETASKESVRAKYAELKEYEEGSDDWWAALSK